MNADRNAHSIRIGDNTVDVSQELYQTYYKMWRHERYLLEAEYKHGIMYYSALDSQDFLGSDLLVDKDEDVEKKVLTKFENWNLYQAIDLLTEDERYLIMQLFFFEKSERVVANILGVYQYAVHKKKKRILKKLRLIMEDRDGKKARL